MPPASKLALSVFLQSLKGAERISKLGIAIWKYFNMITRAVIGKNFLSIQ